MLWLSGMSMLIAMQLRLFASTQWLYDETGSAVQLGILGAIQFSADASGSLRRFVSGYHQPKEIDGIYPVRFFHFNGAVNPGIMERNSSAMDDIHCDRNDWDCEHAG